MGKSGLERKKGKGRFINWLETHQKKADRKEKKKEETVFMKKDKFKHQ